MQFLAEYLADELLHRLQGDLLGQDCAPLSAQKMERSRITAAGNTATHSLATTAIEPQSASLDSLHHYTAHRPILSFRPIWHQNEGCREAGSGFWGCQP
jgi:hypothetical protein